MPNPTSLSAMNLIRLHDADDPSWRETVRQALVEKNSVSGAAEFLGVSHATLKRWLKKDPDVRDELPLPKHGWRPHRGFFRNKEGILVRHRVDPEIVKTLVSLRNEGLTFPQIRKRLASMPETWTRAGKPMSVSRIGILVRKENLAVKGNKK